MDTSKIIRCIVNGRNYTVTSPIVKEDYGLVLKIEGVELPPTYQVDFSNSESNGTSVTMIGNSDGVLIPHQFISTGKDVFAFLYWVGADYGKTVYKFRIPNKLRPDRTNEEPTPEEQSTIDQVIASLNDAVDRAEDAEQAIEDMSVSATTLAEGSSATVTKSEQEGVVHLTFGIPKGQTGDTPAITASKTGKTTSIYVDGSEIAQIEDGTDGINGDDGYSPTANVSKSDKTTTITITDKNGTTSAQVEDGTDGTDGVSPTVTITPITGGHRITITDADGEHSADVMDGDDYTLTAQDKQDIAELVDVPVDDVQINGTSIVSDGVANVPLASESVHGATKYATASEIKSGGGTARSINPYRQHESTFYGLAKSAGDTTQSASSNAVGNYTEDAKRAIREMLGLPRYTESELIADVTTSEELASLTINTDVNGLPFEIRKAKIVVGLKASTTGNADFFTANSLCVNVLNTETTLTFATLKMESANKSVMMYEFDAGEGVSTNRGYVKFESGLSTSAIGVMLSALQLKYLKAFTFKQYSSTSSLIPIGTRIRIFGIRY